MATEPMDIVWSSVQKIAHWGIDHVTKRIDKASGLADPAAVPANPLSGPLPAALSQPMGDMFALPALPSVALPGAAPGIGPTAGPVPSRPIASYSDDVAQGVACINCLRKHLGTMQSSADQLPSPAALARIAAEYHILMRYDLTAEKIAATPEPHQTVVKETVQRLQPIGQQLSTATPQAIALAWGALDESIRFARSNPRTTRDNAEIALRMADVDAYGSYVERVVLAPENRVALKRQFPGYADGDWEKTANSLREARHAMDQDPGLSLPTLNIASAQFAHVAQTLTPEWSASQSQAFRQSIAQVRKQFAQSMLQAMQTKSAVPPTHA